MMDCVAKAGCFPGSDIAGEGEGFSRQALKDFSGDGIFLQLVVGSSTGH